MNPAKKTAIIVGILILVGYAMLGGGTGDAHWLTLLLDVVSGLAVIGIAVLLFPFFKAFNKSLSWGYLVMKFLEGALMIAAGILYMNATTRDLHAWIYNYPQAYVFIVSAYLFYALLLKTKLVPRYISIWGIIACITLLISNLATSFGINSPVLGVLMAPIFLNEIYLAIWLMAKGFSQSAIASETTKA
jgi:hypothetical protein